MKLPLAWLHEYADPGLAPEALAERLAMTGTEVDRVEHHGVRELDAFVVGRVLTAEQHPDADRLRVCTVALGEGDVAHIVCGASNVAAGQTVAVARPGAIMPDGTRLQRAELRGQVSEGMICAEDELGIGTEHAGIMVLEEELEPGLPLASVLPLSTPVLDLEITPNRPDCLGVYGIAREVHAATGAPLAPPPWAADPGTLGELAGVRVEVADPDLCPRFTARLFENVRIGPSPPWLKARLMAAGQRPISNVVDITNYAMLLCGHPLHAFDWDRVEGGLLRVRRARDGETVETLDGLTRTLDAEMLLIEDAAGPTSIAGVMGGARSEVGDGTTRVLMEAANWSGPNIQRTSVALGLRSEASGRFEKGLAPEQALEALIVATRLMLELTGARLVPGTVDVGGPGPAPATIRLRDARLERLLGAPVARARSAAILAALGFGVADAPDGLDVTVPAFRRRDVTREADLVEEVVRIDGVDRLPATLPSRRGASGRLSHAQRARRRAEDALCGAGLTEVVGWSFVRPGERAALRIPAGDPRAGAVALRNPMSEDQSVLRTTLLGSLLDIARHNAARGAMRLALWECGAVYRQPLTPLPEEPLHLGAVMTGPAAEPTWRDPRPAPADVFAAKGALAAALDALRVPWTIERAAEPFLHPGRAARVLVAGEDVGWLGELHPSVAAAWDLDGAVAAFEVDLGRIVARAPAVALFEDVTSHPANRQDLAVVVADATPAARVLAVVRGAGGPVLESAAVFDVYRGEQVGAGRVSLAVRLAFRAPDRTVTDAEAAAARERITGALAAELGAELRG